VYAWQKYVRWGKICTLVINNIYVVEKYGRLEKRCKQEKKMDAGKKWMPGEDLDRRCEKIWTRGVRGMEAGEGGWILMLGSNMDAGENMYAWKIDGHMKKYLCCGKIIKICTHGKSVCAENTIIYAGKKCIRLAKIYTMEKSIYALKKIFTLGKSVFAEKKNMYARKKVCTLRKNMYFCKKVCTLEKKYLCCEKVYTPIKNIYAAKNMYAEIKYVRWEKVCTLGKNMYVGKKYTRRGGGYLRCEKICTMRKNMYAVKKCVRLAKICM
jgi:hypothetical protein